MHTHLSLSIYIYIHIYIHYDIRRRKHSCTDFAIISTTCVSTISTKQSLFSCMVCILLET